jgi:predicted lipoprotein with Yx(FWY)xxD motif
MNTDETKTERKQTPRSKSELAMLYFQNVSPEAASSCLRNWIKDYPPLMAELVEQNYKKHNKLLTPKNVRTIYKYLGDPFE